MSDFTTPFGDSSEKRLPTSDERLNGFPCGPANQALFNGLFNQLQAELNAIHVAGGIAGTSDSVNTTLLNIQALIDAATGGGVLEGYVLLSQASSRLPIFPEFLTTDGKINLTAPATGTVRIPSGVSFLHRGISSITTVQTDFTTVASKTYHVRWSPGGDYQLKDLADTGYNPTVAAETSDIFDSKYDDMLIARVITNSSNIASFTSLVNKNVLQTSVSIDGTDVINSGLNVANFLVNHTLNWSRSPKTKSLTKIKGIYQSGTGSDDEDFNIIDGSYTPRNSSLFSQTADMNVNRYVLNKLIGSDNLTALTMQFNASA